MAVDLQMNVQKSSSNDEQNAESSNEASDMGEKQG